MESRFSSHSQKRRYPKIGKQYEKASCRHQFAGSDFSSLILRIFVHQGYGSNGGEGKEEKPCYFEP